MANPIDEAIVQFLKSKEGQYVSQKLNDLLGDRNYLKGVLADNALIINEIRFKNIRSMIETQISVIEDEIGAILVAQVTIGQQKQETPISETG